MLFKKWVLLEISYFARNIYERKTNFEIILYGGLSIS